MYYALKIAISAILLVAISELGKRSSFWGAVLASLPLVSVFAFVWMYVETPDSAKIADLSTGIFWLVLPSLVLFVALPLLLRLGTNFWLALGLSCVATALSYAVMLRVLKVFGIEL